MKKASFLLLVGLYVQTFCLSGCGQTGPLYLPKPTVDAPKPAAVPSASAASSSASH